MQGVARTGPIQVPVVLFFCHQPGAAPTDKSAGCGEDRNEAAGLPVVFPIGERVARRKH